MPGAINVNCYFLVNGHGLSAGLMWFSLSPLKQLVDRLALKFSMFRVLMTMTGLSVHGAICLNFRHSHDFAAIA